jgi:hypothetical protein
VPDAPDADLVHQRLEQSPAPVLVKPHQSTSSLSAPPLYDLVPAFQATVGNSFGLRTLQLLDKTRSLTSERLESRPDAAARTIGTT